MNALHSAETINKPEASSAAQPPTKRQRITRDYLAGMTIKQLAEKYGRTYGGIQTSLWQWGVRLPEGERLRRLRENQRARGVSWPDCPEHLKADYQTLKRYMTAREARATLEGEK